MLKETPDISSITFDATFQTWIKAALASQVHAPPEKALEAHKYISSNRHKALPPIFPQWPSLEKRALCLSQKVPGRSLEHAVGTRQHLTFALTTEAQNIRLVHYLLTLGSPAKVLGVRQIMAHSPCSHFCVFT